MNKIEFRFCDSLMRCEDAEGSISIFVDEDYYNCGAEMHTVPHALTYITYEEAQQLAYWLLHISNKP